MRRKSLALVPLLLLALLALPVRAQEEPTYTLVIPGGNELNLRIQFVEKQLRLIAVPKPGSTGKVTVDMHVTLDADGRAVAARNVGAGFSGAPVNLAAKVDDSSSLSVISPAEKNVAVVAAPVVSFVDFLAVLGCRYDWKKGGAQTFVYFDPAILRKFCSLFVQADGEPQPLRLSEQGDPVVARRLKITADVPELTEARRVTSLYVGPNGEALKGQMPVTRHRFSASAAGLSDEAAGFTTLYPDGVEPQGNTRFTRIRGTSGGYKITYEGPPHLIRGTVETDTAFRPLRMDHQETWRRMTATMFPDRVSWATPEQRIVTALQGEAWFLTHYVITGIWEKRTPFAKLGTGDSVNVTYPTIEWGDRNGGIYTVRRLADTALADPAGKSVTLKHWQVSSAPYFAADLWTDGERLVKLASSAGASIVRDGWGKAAEKLVAPPKPDR